jgi:hypothetical protein
LKTRIGFQGASWNPVLCFKEPGRAPRAAVRASYSDAKVANRDVRDFGWGIAHAAVSRRPPISLDTMVPRTGGYAYVVGVWDLSIVPGPFSVAPRQTLMQQLHLLTYHARGG